MHVWKIQRMNEIACWDKTGKIAAEKSAIVALEIFYDHEITLTPHWAPPATVRFTFCTEWVLIQYSNACSKLHRRHWLPRSYDMRRRRRKNWRNLRKNKLKMLDVIGNEFKIYYDNKLKTDYYWRIAIDGRLNGLIWHWTCYQARCPRDGDSACTYCMQNVRTETLSHRWVDSASAVGETCFSPQTPKHG